MAAWYYTLAAPDIKKTRALTAQAELLNILLDIYTAMDSGGKRIAEKRRRLTAEIDRLNEAYKDRGKV